MWIITILSNSKITNFRINGRENAEAAFKILVESGKNDADSVALYDNDDILIDRVSF